MTTDAQEDPPEYEEEPLYCACDQTLEQIAQRGFRVSLMGDIQKPGDVFYKDCLSRVIEPEPPWSSPT